MQKSILVMMAFLVFSGASKAGQQYDDNTVRSGGGLTSFDRHMETLVGKPKPSDTKVGNLNPGTSDALDQRNIKVHEINETLEEARKLKAEAQASMDEAEKIRMARKRVYGDKNEELSLSDLNPREVLGAPVNIDTQDVPRGILEILRAMMPAGWEVRGDFHANPDIYDRRFSLLTTDSRSVAIKRFLSQVNGVKLKHKYFFDRIGDDGRHAPLLLVHE